MKKLLICLCLGVFLAAGKEVQAQTSVVQPGPTATDTQQRQEEQDRQRAQQQQRTRDQQTTNDRRIVRDLVNSGAISTRMIMPASVSESLSALYRKTTKEELKQLAPDKADQNKYAEILRQDNTGLTRLVANKGCADNPNVIVATPECLAYSMPGAGSSYSFRVADYRIARLADLTFTGTDFQAQGIILHGIFAELGDAPLEQINLQTKGLDFLVKFKPEIDYQKSQELDKKLEQGITADGFLYTSGIPAKLDTTYILRSIAYRGSSPRAVEGYTFNELDFDKRSDIIVAFRVVRKYDDGAVLILWKRLSKNDSPKTKWKEDEDKDTPPKSTNLTAEKD